MPWNDLSIGKKLFVGFGLIILLITAALFGTNQLSSRLSALGASAVEKTLAGARLGFREADHLKWTEAVSNFIASHGENPLEVQLDGTKCAFGLWYGSSERESLEQAIPGVRPLFAQIEQPHLRLHQSAAEIRDSIQRKDETASLDVYKKVTRPMSNEVVSLLNQTRGLVVKAALEDKQKFTDLILEAQWFGRVLTVLSVLLAAALAFFITRSLSLPLKHIVRVAKNIAQGDLGARVKLPSRKDEVGLIAASVNSMVDTLNKRICESEALAKDAREAEEHTNQALTEAREKDARICEVQRTVAHVVGQAFDIADNLQTTTGQIVQNADGVREQSLAQSEGLESVATSMTQVNAAMLDIARNAEEAARSASMTLDRAQQGAQVVDKSVASIQKVNEAALLLQKDMENLGQQANSIGHVMGVISDIADQTNLLALNAAIEAARAGEAGRGFSVVADEVRKLAEKTMHATQEVNDKITSIQSSVQKGIANMREATAAVETASHLSSQSGDSLKEIVELAGLNTTNSQSIAAASEEHSAASSEITGHINEVTSIARNITNNMVQSVQMVHGQMDTVKELHTLIAKLKQA